MKMFTFDGPGFHFWAPSLDEGEIILRALAWLYDDVDTDDYTATEVEVQLK